MIFKAISESTHTLSIFTIITTVVLRFTPFLRQNVKYVFHVIHIIIFSPGILSQILLPSRDTLRYAGRSLNARYCALGAYGLEAKSRANVFAKPLNSR